VWHKPASTAASEVNLEVHGNVVVGFVDGQGKFHSRAQVTPSIQTRSTWLVP